MIVFLCLQISPPTPLLWFPVYSTLLENIQYFGYEATLTVRTKSSIFTQSAWQHVHSNTHTHPHTKLAFQYVIHCLLVALRVLRASRDRQALRGRYTMLMSQSGLSIQKPPNAALPFNPFQCCCTLAAGAELEAHVNTSDFWQIERSHQDTGAGLNPDSRKMR